MEQINEALQPNTDRTKLPLIILTGPTAVGKTDLSIALVKALEGEVISADSMQVYRRMDIGTAKIRREEMQGVPHHLIDILEPQEPFDVVQFQQLARDAIRDITARGRIPIVVGGTGFYIQALLYDIDFTEEEDTSLRTELEQQAETEEGREALVEELRRVDPDALLTIHPNNLKRVIRAVEFYRLHGTQISKHNETERKKESAYNSLYFVLTDNRARLYERINLRVDKMLDAGLLDEVRRLKEEGLGREHISMQGIGYKEILEYLEGMAELSQAVENLKQNTRHFAKRQLTWFRREKDVIWLDRTEHPTDAELLQIIMKYTKERGIGTTYHGSVETVLS